MQQSFINENDRRRILFSIVKKGEGVFKHRDGSTRFYVKLTAEEATQIITLFPSPPPHNRDTKEREVRNYLRQMSQGDWSMCLDPIVISDTGYIIAGKHRLTAQSRSGQTVEWSMVFDGPESLRKGLQGGKPHSIGNLLHITTNAQAVVNILWSMESGRYQVKIGETEARTIYNKYKDDLEEVSNILTVKPWRNAPVIAAFTIALSSSKVDRTKVLELANNLRDMSLLTPGSSAISKLVTGSGKKPTTSTDRNNFTIQILRGIYAHLKNEKIKTLIASDHVLSLFGNEYEYVIPGKADPLLEIGMAAE